MRIVRRRRKLDPALHHAARLAAALLSVPADVRYDAFVVLVKLVVEGHIDGGAVR